MKNLRGTFSYLSQGACALLVISLFVSMPWGTTPVAHAVSATMNYQGKLTTSANVAVPDGTYNMHFWLIASSTAPTSTAVWTETRTGGDRVQVTNGLFSVMLGSVASLSGVDFSQGLYLGVEIGGTGGSPVWDGEMLPRKTVGTVPAAFVAATSTFATTASTSNFLSGIASSSFLRSDQDDSASGLLTFTGGFLSTASSTITGLTTGIATTTTLVINNSAFTSLTGTGLTNNGGVLSVATSSLGFGSLAWLSSVDISANTNLGVTATGLNLSGDNIALTTGYTIPLTASTTEWASAYASTTAFTPTYIRGLFSNTATGLTYNSGTGATSLTAGYTIPLTASTTEWANKVSSQWITNGANIYYNTGNVGIGTSTPGMKVDAYLGSVSNNTSNFGYNVFADAGGAVGYSGYNLFLNNSTANASGYLRLARTSGTTFIGMEIASQSRDGLRFLTGTTTPNEVLRISANGNVGIGTTTPGYALTVAGDTNITGALRFNGSAGTAGQILMSNGASAPAWSATSSLGLRESQWTTTGSDIYYNTGNVGVGLINPYSRFTVVSNNVASSTIRLQSPRAVIVAGNILGGIDFASNDTNLTDPGVTTASILALATQSHSASALGTDLAFLTTTGTTTSESMRITGTGRVGIGTTTPNDTLAVSGTASVLGSMNLLGVKPALAGGVYGTSASTILTVVGGDGGDTTSTGSGANLGGAGGGVQMTGGAGGIHTMDSIYSANGGPGGGFNFTGGTGGAPGRVSGSNNGGGGGGITLTAGAGGSPNASTTGSNNGGNGGSVTIAAGVGGDGINGAAHSGGYGGNLTLRSGDGGLGDTSGDGGNISIISGDAGSTTKGQGGDISILAGNGGNFGGTYQYGGDISLTAGNAGSGGTGYGGRITLTGGAGNDAGTAGGLVTIQGGPAGAASGGMGGGVSIYAADGSSVGSGGNGGNVTLASGAGGGTGNRVGGTLSLSAGDAGTGNGAGGAIILNAGDANFNPSGTGGIGGALTLTGGVGGMSTTTGGAGGSLTIAAGIGGVASSTSGAGGVLYLDGGRGGAASGGSAGAGGTIVFRTSADNSAVSERARFSNAGNFLINNTDGQSLLTVARSATETSQIALSSQRTAVTADYMLGGLDFVSNDTNLGAGGLATARISARTTQAHTGSALGTDLLFYTTANNSATPAERMRLTNAGYLGIGTTTPGYALTVAGDTNITGALRFNGSAGTAGQILMSNGASAPAWAATSSLGLSSSFSNSAQLAALLSDETGTGNAVFSASPTFTGNITAASATLSSLLSLSGSSANISLGSNYLSGDGDDEGVYVGSNGNVGIGAIADGVVSRKLWIQNTSTTTTGLQVRMQASATSSDLFTEYASATGSVRFIAGLDGSADAFRIVGSNTMGSGYGLTVTQDDNVGIRTKIPTKLFTVEGPATSTGAMIASFGAPLGTGQWTGIHIGYVQGVSGDTSQKAGIIFESTSNARGTLHFVNDNTADSSNADLADARMSITAVGNVGIGTTTPSAKLHITGTAGGGDIFAISSSTNSRLLTLTAAGNLGIGTTTPAAYLQIVGTTEQLRLGYDASNYWKSTIGSTGGLTMQGVGTGGSLTISPTAGQDMNVNLSGAGDFAVNTNQLFVDTSTGNVGIATTSPFAALSVGTLSGTDATDASGRGVDPAGLLVHINTGVSKYAAVFSNDSGNNAGVLIKSKNTQLNVVDQSNVSSLYVNSGKVGVLNNNPSGILSVGALATTTISDGLVSGGSLFSVRDTMSGQYAGVIQNNSSNSHGLLVQAGDTNNHQFFVQNYTGGTTYFAVAGGKSAFGTSSPKNILDIAGGAVIGSSYAGVNTAPTDGLLIQGKLGIGTTTPQQMLHVVRSDDGPPVRFQDSNGYCEMDPTTTTWTCTSDARLKKDIESLDTGTVLADLSKLRAVSFRWKKDTDSDEKRTGLIAQEVEAIFPNLVTTDASTGYKAVSYGGFTAYLIAGVDELAQENTQLASLLATGTSTFATSSPFYALVNGQDTIWSRMVKLAQGFVDGILTIAGVHTDELCVGDVCVDQATFLKMVQNAEGTPTAPQNDQNNSGGDGGDIVGPVQPPVSSTTTDQGGSGTTTPPTDTGTTTESGGTDTVSPPSETSTSTPDAGDTGGGGATETQPTGGGEVETPEPPVPPETPPETPPEEPPDTSG